MKIKKVNIFSRKKRKLTFSSIIENSTLFHIIPVLRGCNAFNCLFTAEMNPCIAVIQYDYSNRKHHLKLFICNLTQVIGLTNDDAVLVFLLFSYPILHHLT